MNKKLLSAILPLFIFCSCCTTTVDVQTSPQGNKKAIPLADLSILDRQTKLLAPDSAELVFTTDRGFAEEIPAPQDLLMEFLKRNSANRKITLIAANQDSIIGEWNLYAAEKIFNGCRFDRKEQRKAFLEQRFGAAAPSMLQYFRLLERRMLFSGSTCNLGYDAYPDNSVFCENDLLIELETALADAAKKADSPAAAAAVNKEQQIFGTYKQKLTEYLKRNLRIAVANSGEKYYFSTLMGKKADVDTFFQLDVNDNYLILTLTAIEPAPPEDRRAEKHQRDYENLWKEDSFEIFLLPEPGKTTAAWQFIINSKGSIWDTVHKEHNIHNNKWNASGAKVEYSQLDGAWRIIFSIPWQDLGFDGIPEKPFYANIYRNRAIKKTRTKAYCWSPIRSGSYNQPRKFGIFLWEKKNK